MPEMTPLQKALESQRYRVQQLELEVRDAGTKLAEAREALWKIENLADKEREEGKCSQ